MRVLAIGHLTGADIAPHLEDEQRVAKQLREEGFILDSYDEHRLVHVVDAESEDALRATLARDPWSETHLRVETITRERSGSPSGTARPAHCSWCPAEQ